MPVVAAAVVDHPGKSVLIRRYFRAAPLVAVAV